MDLKNELYRKILHVLLILIPISFCLLGKSLFLLIFVPIASIIVFLDKFRGKNQQINQLFLKIFSPILRQHELTGQKLCGASWVALAVIVNFAIFSKEIAVTSFVVLIICDAAAALVGKSVKSEPFFEKSIAGALAFLGSGVFVLIICGLIFDVRAWFYFFGLFALACTAIIESRPSLFKIDDNFTIPIAFSSILAFFDFAWNL